MENDIALIRLPDEVALRDNVHVACLPESTLESVPDKDKCFVAGWGQTGISSIDSTSGVSKILFPGHASPRNFLKSGAICCVL